MSNKDGTILVNICILPTSNVASECVKISQSLGTSNTLFVLGGDKFAHMTVYMARFPAAELKNVIAATQQALSGQISFSCTHVGYFMTEDRYLEVSYRKSPEFLALHEKLIANLKDLRANLGKPTKESYFGLYAAQQQKNAKSTGYDLAYDLYRPHITLARYKEGQAPSSFPALPETKLSFDFGQLGICEADANGAVFRKLAEFII